MPSHISVTRSFTLVQIPLWTIVTKAELGLRFLESYVQIPLWTIVTVMRVEPGINIYEFRFLYGRL